jgi:hypothetical protein
VTNDKRDAPSAGGRRYCSRLQAEAEFLGRRFIVRAVTSLVIVLACVATVGILYVVVGRFPAISNRGERRLLIFAAAAWAVSAAASLIDGEIPYAALVLPVVALAYLLLDRGGKARQRV